MSRVLAPGGILAVVGYHMTSPGPRVANSERLRAAMTRVYHATKPYWTGARVHVDEGYVNLPGAETMTELRLVIR